MAKKKQYKAFISFYVDFEHIDLCKNRMAQYSDNIEAYEDEDGWCVDCLINNVEGVSTTDAQRKIGKIANSVGYTWDFHYILAHIH